MNQTQELARVKARIKALTEKTVANGCTEAEAMSAVEMVGRLLERYALSMDEIEVRTARCVQVEVELGSRAGARSTAPSRRSPGSVTARSGSRRLPGMATGKARSPRAFGIFSSASRPILPSRPISSP